MKWFPYWAFLPMRRYYDFSGRSRRQEFWCFTLATWIIGAALDMLDERLGLQDERAVWVLGASGVLGATFSFATLLPSIAVSVRRAHDIGRSGWWLAPPAVSLVGSIVAMDAIFGASDHPNGNEIGALVATAGLLGSFLILLIVFCLDGTQGRNRFGEDPKGVAYEGVFD